MMKEKTFWTVERFVFGRWKELYVQIQTEALALELFDKAKAEYDQPMRLVRIERYVIQAQPIE